MLRQNINQSLKDAMKAKDEIGTATLRLILAALKDRDIAARSNGKAEGVDEAEILEMLQKMVRQRRDSIEMYEKGGRKDLAEREAQEIEVITGFLPQPMSDAEIAEAIEAAIAELDASSIKDMGRIMGHLKQSFTGRMDFGKASAEVKRRLM
ncbi:MAG: GatB/YqeY domain-containing protein [Kiloniellales bacterium]|nr:GatB/YqeY domain-containing protein [Kiloniellales bacterium]